MKNVWKNKYICMSLSKRILVKEHLRLFLPDEVYRNVYETLESDKEFIWFQPKSQT